MEHSYRQITSEEDRKAPKGKYRVMLNDRGENSALYFVKDCDRAEEAICLAETLNKKDQNGIVQDSKGWGLYPWFDGHQMRTRKELLDAFGRECKAERDSRPMTAAHINAIEARQSERIPGWKRGDRMVVYWSDISEATGSGARFGDV